MALKNKTTGLINAVFFDLDGTLYDSRTYSFKAARDAAKAAEKYAGADAKNFERALIESYKKRTSHYGKHITDTLRRQGLDLTHVKKIVAAFNAHKPRLKTYPGLKPLLRKLREKYFVGIITDGLPARQKRKIAALGIGGYFDAKIFSDETGERKPSVKPFRAALKAAGVKRKEAVYFGDNPLIDIAGAKKAGMKAVRVRMGELKNLDNKTVRPDAEIGDIRDAGKILARLAKKR